MFSILSELFLLLFLIKLLFESFNNKFNLLIGLLLAVNILAFLLGCVLASVIHLTMMAIKKADRYMSFGPYLSAGIYIAMIWGEQLVSWYLSMWAFKSL